MHTQDNNSCTLLSITIDEEWIYDLLEDANIDDSKADEIFNRISINQNKFDTFLDTCRSSDKDLVFNTLQDVLKAFINQEADDLLDGDYL